MGNKIYFYAFFTVILLAHSPCLARTEPGVTLATGFSSLTLTDLTSTEVRLSSSRIIEVRPEITWTSETDFRQITLQAILQSYTFEPPQYIDVSHNAENYFGLNLSYFKPLKRLGFSFGLEAQEIPVLDANAVTTLVLNHGLYLALPVNLTYKLSVVERQVLRVGAGAKIFYPGLNQTIKSGNSISANMSLEIRGWVRSQFMVSYDQRRLTSAYGSQKDYLLLLALKLSLPGQYGLTPPPDERN